MEAFVEGFGAATGHIGRSRVKLDAVASCIKVQDYVLPLHVIIAGGTQMA